MQISKERCVGCANCTAVCPMGAIYIAADGLAEIDREACVECHNCYRGMSFEHLPPEMVRAGRRLLSQVQLRFQPDPDVCPTEALVPEELEWPRIVRRAFSDPMVTHESTGVHGRGTEEVKTNDITNRIQQGDAGFVVELGRPGIGVYFRDVQTVTKALAAAGAEFEAGNPVTGLMTDPGTGEIREDLHGEKVLSCIVELKAALDEVPGLLEVVEEVAKDFPSVISLGVSTRTDANGEEELQELLRSAGYDTWRAKVNLGMGRATSFPGSGPAGLEEQGVRP